jgi:hypothetical protein
MAVSPTVLSLIVCDQIIVDRMSGKTSLIGMFGHIGAERFPVRHPQLCVFASLTDGRGKAPLRISIVDANDKRPPVVSGQANVEFRDPRAIACLNLHFTGLVFPEADDYRVQVLSDDAILSEARLQLTTIRRRKKNDDSAEPGSPHSP